MGYIGIVNRIEPINGQYISYSNVPFEEWLNHYTRNIMTGFGVDIELRIIELGKEAENCIQELDDEESANEKFGGIAELKLIVEKLKANYSYQSLLSEQSPPTQE